MPTFDVCGLGGVCWDFVGVVEHYPLPDEKAALNELIQMGGGLAGTAMSAVAALGGRASVFGRLGDDDFGDNILQAFQREGVDITGLQVVPGATSQFAFCIALAATGQRSIFWRAGSYPRLNAGEVDLARLTDCRCLLVDHHHMRASIEAAHYAREHGVPVVLDLERTQPGDAELLWAVDYPIVPARFVLEFTGEESLAAAAAALRGRGLRTLIVTQGERGVSAFVEDSVLHRPAYAVAPIVDTTGAGDVFHGAFAYAVALGYELAGCLDFAAGAAALSCCGLGGRGALPGRAAVEHLVAASAAPKEEQ